MDKREARKEFKSRITPKGVFALRCMATKDAWAGGSHHLNSERNGLWFMLRGGLHHNKGLQAAWKSHGEETFQFEVVETLDDDIAPLLLKDTLKERQKYWEKELGAAPV